MQPKFQFLIISLIKAFEHHWWHTKLAILSCGSTLRTWELLQTRCGRLPSGNGLRSLTSSFAPVQLVLPSISEFGADFPSQHAYLPTFQVSFAAFQNLQVFPLPIHWTSTWDRFPSTALRTNISSSSEDEATGQWKTGPAAAYLPQMCQCWRRQFRVLSAYPGRAHQRKVTPLDDASHAQPHLASLSLGPTLDPKPPSVGVSSTSRVKTASEPSNQFEKDKTHFGILIFTGKSRSAGWDS